MVPRVIELSIGEDWGKGTHCPQCYLFLSWMCFVIWWKSFWRRTLAAPVRESSTAPHFPLCKWCCHFPPAFYQWHQTHFGFFTTLWWSFWSENKGAEEHSPPHPLHGWTFNNLTNTPPLPYFWVPLHISWSASLTLQANQNSGSANYWKNCG